MIKVRIFGVLDGVRAWVVGLLFAAGAWPAGYGVEVNMGPRAMHTDAPPRTRQRGQIAAFLDVRTVVISRGEREGVELGDCYVILSNDVDGDWAALLRVFEVKEKMVLAKAIWVLPGAPVLRIGWNVFRVDRYSQVGEEEMAMKGKPPVDNMAAYMRRVGIWAERYDQEAVTMSPEEFEALYDEAFFEAMELEKK